MLAATAMMMPAIFELVEGKGLPTNCLINGEPCGRTATTTTAKPTTTTSGVTTTSREATSSSVGGTVSSAPSSSVGEVTTTTAGGGLPFTGAASLPMLFGALVLLGLAGTSFAVGVPLVNAWFPPSHRGMAVGILATTAEESSRVTKGVRSTSR